MGDFRLIKTLKSASGKSASLSREQLTYSAPSLYDISINTLENQPIALSDYKGRYLLFVNVASECGFTNQYEALERLFQKQKEHLMIIGVPCNQFGAQESGSAAEIKDFCERNYGVSFLMTEKIKVKGPGQHPLYQWLTKEKMNGVKNSTVRWNFQKYLVGPNGSLLDFYYSLTRPESTKITRHIKA